MTMMKMENISTKGDAIVRGKVPLSECDQTFFGRGKLLLSGEYFVLDGATALCLPTRMGQGLSIRYRQSFEPVLHWKSLTVNGDLWFEGKYEFWHFKTLSTNPSARALQLEKILIQIREMNPHFLRESTGVHVETKLGFPLKWGLGSSSSLIYNLAQWAIVDPYKLHEHVFGGSGYDIACARADGPILYQKGPKGPVWSKCNFNPSFKKRLYFVYLGRKQDTRESIRIYREKAAYNPVTVRDISRISEEMVRVSTLDGLDYLIKEHEDIVSNAIGLERAKNIFFKDYWGEVKSLGGWGGDFVLVTSERSREETKNYFHSQGFNVFIPFEDLIAKTGDFGGRVQ